ncbi:VOC family protein [Candidatus Bathyarchaeota archaeon]|nr:VOC family protein [Candidatus Bathyarchaeota archaeon]
MFKQADYVIIGVSDMARSVNFYHNILGLPLKFETKEWSEFDTGKTIIALHPAAKGAKPVTGSESILPGSCSIGFVTSDIESSFRQLQSKGVSFVQPPVSREGEGIKLAVFLDPDGLALSISQALEPTEKTESSPISA